MWKALFISVRPSSSAVQGEASYTFPCFSELREPGPQRVERCGAGLEVVRGVQQCSKNTKKSPQCCNCVTAWCSVCSAVSPHHELV
ncbi:hypothetical protein AAFF_G00084970 [Aldrovandia affinis]|uniref:Uncharacterized protein n=1 Tax=Aldrovandia affinis TaxID=143900 RepID=A0AAD7RZJ3_9TELE|nr:hypothetical protein AAFF_G00084970 [Aldrovandia affinis]